MGAIVAGGAADLDGRLQIGDEITHINGRSVLDASHRDVISLMGTASAQGEVVLSIRRKMPMPGVSLSCVCVCVGGGGVWVCACVPAPSFAGPALPCLCRCSFCVDLWSMYM